MVSGIMGCSGFVLDFLLNNGGRGEGRTKEKEERRKGGNSRFALCSQSLFYFQNCHQYFCPLE